MAPPGYRLVTTEGRVISFGQLATYQVPPPGSAAVGMASTADGYGYWLALKGGGVRAVGDAHLYGSMAKAHLTRPSWAWPPLPTAGATGWCGGWGRFWVWKCSLLRFGRRDACTPSRSWAWRPRPTVAATGWYLLVAPFRLRRRSRLWISWHDAPQPADRRLRGHCGWPRLLDGGLRRWHLCLWRCPLLWVYGQGASKPADRWSRRYR